MRRIPALLLSGRGFFFFALSFFIEICWRLQIPRCRHGKATLEFSSSPTPDRFRLDKFKNTTDHIIVRFNRNANRFGYHNAHTDKKRRANNIIHKGRALFFPSTF